MKNLDDKHTMHVEITIKGSISPEMEAWFEGLSISPENGNSRINGILPDQQALYGLINMLRDLGVTIISIQTQPDMENHRSKE